MMTLTWIHIQEHVKYVHRFNLILNIIIDFINSFGYDRISTTVTIVIILSISSIRSIRSISTSSITVVMDAVRFGCRRKIGMLMMIWWLYHKNTNRNAFLDGTYELWNSLSY